MTQPIGPTDLDDLVARVDQLEQQLRELSQDHDLLRRRFNVHTTEHNA